ncbi:hypothetical protein C8F04DRAFT_1062213 [Mycena alexandri]|uniref:Uncharacterized protein n=1 Tax=Mycena alexandri TaxID=1745969 RepID=A0AAD6TIW0_9AGAR|nr:hypothetical protein C8F04DRAFT_1062213 [Mycena alexandri]
MRMPKTPKTQTCLRFLRVSHFAVYKYSAALFPGFPSLTATAILSLTPSASASAPASAGLVSHGSLFIIIFTSLFVPDLHTEHKDLYAGSTPWHSHSDLTLARKGWGLHDQPHCVLLQSPSLRPLGLVHPPPLAVNTGVYTGKLHHHRLLPRSKFASMIMTTPTTKIPTISTMATRNRVTVRMMNTSGTQTESRRRQPQHQSHIERAIQRRAAPTLPAHDAAALDPAPPPSRLWRLCSPQSIDNGPALPMAHRLSHNRSAPRVRLPSGSSFPHARTTSISMASKRQTHNSPSLSPNTSKREKKEP